MKIFHLVIKLSGLYGLLVFRVFDVIVDLGFSPWLGPSKIPDVKTLGM